jgi:hypothetical protein
MPTPRHGVGTDQHGILLASLFAAAALSLSYGLQVSDGMLQPDALLALTLCSAFTLAAFLVPPIGRVEKLGERLPIWLLGAALALEFGLLLARPPGIYLQTGPPEYARFQFGVGIAAVLAGAALCDDRWLGRVAFPLLLVTHVLLGAWVLRASPDPQIDVSFFHRDAFAALLRGENPHAGSIPNIYGHSRFYGEGIVENGRVLVGHPYPPLSLLLTFATHQIAGDYRYVLVIAVTAAAALIAYARNSRISIAAASAFLFTPRVFFVYEQGWTDCLSALMFVLTVFVACRAPRFLWVALGLLLAIKQYLVAVVPLVFLLLPGAGTAPSRLSTPLDASTALGASVRTVLKAAALAVALTLPMFVWNPSAFLKDLFWFQIRQPFRTDALSYLAWYAQRTGTQLGSWLGFAAMLPALALGALRAPRSAGGFAAASGLLFLAFFAFNKQAFCNYYFFLLAVLFSAAGTVSRSSPGAGKV